MCSQPREGVPYFPARPLNPGLERAGTAADRNEGDSVPPGDELALLLRPDASERARRQLEGLLAGVKRHRSLDDEVDLLLPVLGVVVVGIVCVTRRKALDVHAERGHTEPLAREQEPAAPPVRLELVQLLPRHISHRPSPPCV